MADNMTARGNKFGILLMIVSSCCVCIGQLFWKLSADGNLLYLCMGFLLYGAGFLAMVTAYKYGSVSKLQPILSLNYVFAVLLGLCVLGESITLHKIAGIVIITVSVAAIGSSVD
jgi:undecaprenyl phosphate-alpha-L-ara4N flippase subunit ArnE